MPTAWFYPNIVTQSCEIEEHVPWINENDFLFLKHADGIYVTLSKPLLHISNSVVNDVKMKTYYLNLSDFRITGLPNTISGIEVEVNMNRGGRITDETVQLTYQDQIIGKNYADFDLSPKKLYGGSSDLWSIQLTASEIASSDFGIKIRFQSHPSWPHCEYAKIDYVRLRAY